LVRHGETLYNRERRMQGHMDIPLSDLGLKEAKKLARRLQNEQYDYIYSSDLARAYVTAKTCFPNSEIIVDKRLRERSYGTFEGKLRSEYSPQELEIYNAYKRDPFKNRLTGGENSYELFARINNWLQEIPKTNRVIAFTHGGVVRSLIREVNGKDAEIGKVENTSISHFRYNDAVLELISYNDAGHLRE